MLPPFYFKTGADKLVDLMRDEQVTIAELAINIVVWISVPNEAYDLYKKLAISSEPRVTCLQQCECGAAHPCVF